MKTHHLEGLCQHYLSQKNVSKSTIKSYKIAFKYYIAYLTENKIQYAKTSDVITYRESRRRLGYSSEYIYIHMCALKGLYCYLRLNQKRLDLPAQYAYDIMIQIKNERIKHRIKKPILTIEQAKQLIIHTKNKRLSIWHYRDHAIIYLMMTSGLRSIEIVRAKRIDYQVVDGKRRLYVPGKRGGVEDEFVNLSKGAEEAVNDYLTKRKDDNPYLFITTKNTSPDRHLSRTFFTEMFKRVLKDCGLERSGITPHCLRHTAATMNLLRGGSIEQTRSLMRHESIESTLVYAHHIQQMKDDSAYQIDAFILKEEGLISYDAFILSLET